MAGGELVQGAKSLTLQGLSLLDYPLLKVGSVAHGEVSNTVSLVPRRRLPEAAALADGGGLRLLYEGGKCLRIQIVNEGAFEGDAPSPDRQMVADELLQIDEGLAQVVCRSL